MDKNELRKYIKAKIEENKANLESESQIVCEKLLSDKAFLEAPVLLAYMSLPDEVDVLPVIKEALKMGKKVAVPRVIEDSQNRKMLFYYLKDDVDLAVQVESGYYGISEPDVNNLQFSCEETFESAFIIVPGRAFTKDGKRLGRGKGFYDVFLSQLINECKTAGKRICAAGVCFSCQLVDFIPADENDISVDKIVCAIP